MIKVLTIVGTRPEIIKLCRVIAQLDKHTNHILVHTGQNFDYELNEIFFKQLGIRKPNYFMNSAGKNAAETIANVIKSTDEILEREAPDALLIYGDTNSCLSVIAAKRRKVPIFHMEAGNRCFDLRVPEEINRKVVDHLSDINMVLSEHARRYLISEGIRPDSIIKTGSSMREVFLHYQRDIETCDILSQEYLEAGGYIIVSAHREENIDSDDNFRKLIDSLKFISSEFKKKIIVSTHPRTKKKLSELNAESLGESISFMKPFGFFEYIKLQQNAFCVVSDSGTITEESSLLAFPAVTIRQAHERPEGMDEGTVIMCGLEPKSVVASIRVATSHFAESTKPFSPVQDYMVENVSRKVLKIILSYTEFVNRKTWYKAY